MNINWETYNEIYPDRYIKKSSFDEKISYYISLYKEKINILDIGGGKYGSITEIFPNHCYLLDPFIKKCPKNYIGKIDWNSNLKFDLIICRGAFNYLSIEEIGLINNFMNKGSVFLFNTFSKPTEGTRTFEKNGIIEGFEETIFIDNKLRHKLYRKNGDVIEHDILYYTSKQINEFFKDNLITKESNGNSDYYFIRKKIYN